MQCGIIASSKATRCPVRPVSPASRAPQAAAEAVSRRGAAVALGGALALFSQGPAEAFLGFGEDPGKQYTDETSTLLNNINSVLALGADDDKEGAVKQLKREMNDWTAHYRINGQFAGRPSFSNMYSAVNALAGHWNSFGADAPVPKKRMARISKELEDVGKLLARGR